MKIERKIPQVIAIFVIIMVCCLNMGKLNYIAVLNDEFGYWANAVSILGYDWKELIAVTPYYSMGYSVWLIPIIFLLRTPELWYKAAIILNILFLIGSFFLCCKVGKELFPNTKAYIINFVSLIVIIFPGNIAYAHVAWSETLQFFLIWCVTYCITQLEKHFSYSKAILMLSLLIYMQMVHARNIGILAIGIVSFIFLMKKNKSNIRYWFLGIAYLIVGLFLVNQVKKYQLSVFWSTSAMSQTNNITANSTTVNHYFKLIVDNIVLLLESLGGKLFYLLLGTGLTFFIGIFDAINTLFHNIKKKNIWLNNYISRM